MKRSLPLFLLLSACGADTSTALEPTSEPLAPETAAPTAAAPTAVATSAPTATPTAAATASAASTTTASAPPPATATASAAPAGPAPLEGANMTIGSFSADGLALKDISCKTDGGLGGLMGSMTIAAGLSKKKAALDKCGKGDARAHLAKGRQGHEGGDRRRVQGGPVRAEGADRRSGDDGLGVPAHDRARVLRSNPKDRAAALQACHTLAPATIIPP
ncbi:MAG: hypothetical protein IPM79_01060 [Polyangiaceae bacterium]|nr:hypothetical protein [Polyangiaceae bacterium]